MHFQAVELLLGRGGQGIVRHAHVGEFGVGVDLGNHARRQRGITPRRILERSIGVPQPVAQAVGALAIVGLEYLAVVVHVGNIRNGIVAEAVCRQRRRARLGMQRTVKALRERELFRIGKRLVAKHQHAVFIHAGAQLLQRGAVVYLAQINRADFAADVGMQLAYAHCHGVNLQKIMF